MSEVYPSVLLPQPNFKYIDCDLSNFYFIRYFEIKAHIPIIDDNNDIAQTYICSPTSNIQDLSMSLLSHYEYEHVKILLTELGIKNYSHYCLPSYPGQPLIYKDEFLKTESRGYWLIEANLCDSLKCDITFVKEKVEIQYTAKSKKKHTPMRWNFWHFSLLWHIEGLGQLGDLEIFTDDKERKKFANKIGAKMRSKLPSIVKLKIKPPIIKMASTCYQN
jgi:hypothetical protein